VKFARADETLKRLRQSRFENSRDAEVLALTTVDLLILDEFALEPMTKDESKDVYQLRTGRGSMVVTPIETPPSGSRCSRAKRRRSLPQLCRRRRRRRRVVPIEAQAEDRDADPPPTAAAMKQPSLRRRSRRRR